MILPKESRGKT